MPLILRHQWFSSRRTEPPLQPRHVTMNGVILGCHNWRRVYWHLVGREEGCCQMSFEAPTTENGGTGWPQGLLAMWWYQSHGWQCGNSRQSAAFKSAFEVEWDFIRLTKKRPQFPQIENWCLEWSVLMDSLEGKNTKGLCPHHHRHDPSHGPPCPAPACDICPTKKTIQLL